VRYDVEHNGYAFGLQFQHPLYRRTGYWVRAGGLYTHIGLEDDDGGLAGDTDHEFGWEAGGGLRVPLSERFALMPGVRYRALSADLRVGDTTTPVDLSYVALEIGLQFSFGARPGITALVR
jgi:opacity protein-like surface antigen